MVERRQPKPTVDFIDEYCQYYRNLFSDVRDLQVINCPTVSQNFRAKPRRVVVSLDRATPTVGQFIFWIFLRGFEAFKYLHMGMISEIKPKTLPAIAKVVGLDNHQPLHHFLTVSPWDIKLLRDLQVINCPTVSQNFRAKPRRVVVSLDRATPTVGQFIFWIFLRDLQVINCPTVSQNFRAKPRRVVVSLDRATPTVGQFIFWIFLRDLQVINCPTVSQNFRAKPRRVVVSLDRATPTVGQFIFWIFLRDLQVINCPTVSQNFRAKPRRVVVSLDRATPTVGQFIFWIFLRDLQVINCPTVSQNFRAKPRRVVVSLDRATPTVGQFIFWIFLRDLQVINCPTVSQNFRAKPRRVVVSLDRATPTVGQFIFWIFLRDLQVINCPTVSQNFRAKPRRVVVSLDRATPTVGQFIFWIFLTEIRLQLILDILSGRPIILMIDETGDKKKGKSTDYVKRQYIGNLGKTDNGIVAVTAYAVFCGMTFPLTFEIYKPRERLKEGDKYLTKPQIAAQMIKELGTCK